MALQVVIGPDGKPHYADPADISALSAEGYTPETPEQATSRVQQATYGDTAGQVKAGLLGAASGATLGASSAALSQLGLMSPTDIEGLQAANPVSKGVGEAAGILGSLALAPEASGPGLVAKAGRAATAGMGKWGARLAGSAVEGGLFGLGNSVSEQMVAEDPKLSAEKLLAAGTGGALAGIGTNLLGGVAVDAGSALWNKFAGTGMRGSLNKFANNRMMRALGAEKRDIKGMGLEPKESQVIGEWARTHGFDKALGTPAVMHPIATSILEQESAKVGAGLGAIDAAAPQGFDMPTWVAQARAKFSGPLSQDPALRHEYNALETLLQQYDQLPTPSFEKAWAFQSNLRKARGPADPLKDLPVLNQLQQDFREAILTQAETAAPGLGKAMRQISRDYRNAKTVESLLAREVAGDQFSASPGGADLADAAAGGVFGGVRGIARRAIGRRADFMLASVSGALADAGASNLYAKGAFAAVQKGLQNPAWGGAFRQSLELAASRGAEDTLATHVQLANSSVGHEYLKEVGMPDETPDAAHQYAQRTQQLLGLQAQIAQADAKMENALGRLTEQTAGRAPEFKSPPMTAERFKKMSDLLVAANTDPQTMAALLEGTTSLSGHAPNVGVEVNATMTRASKFLHDTMPRDPNPPTVKSLQQAWEPSKADLGRWNRYVSTVQSPLQVIADVKKGTLTAEQVQTLQVVYPELLKDIQSRMMKRLGEWNGSVPYNQRYTMSLLFGKPVGGAGDPKRARLIQQAHQSSVAQQEQQSSAGGGGDGRQTVDTAKNMQTQSARNLGTLGQHIEARGQQ